MADTQPSLLPYAFLGLPGGGRSSGYFRGTTPGLENLLRRKGLWVDNTTELQVLKYDQKNVVIVYWLDRVPLGYLMTVASVGRDIARLGAFREV